MLARSATIKTLYVHRKLLNGDDVVAWAKAQGFKTTLPADDLHVTIAFSRAPVEWPEPNLREVTVSGGVRTIEALGPNADAIVLRFASPELSSGWKRFIDAGASWDWDGYKPHVTISFQPVEDINSIAAYTGELRFGPEVFAEVKDDWKDAVKEEHYPGGQDHDQQTHAGDGGGGSDSAGFVSPNVRNDLDFEGAVDALDSDQQKSLRAASADINRQCGIEARESDIIGAWADGAENSVMMSCRTDFERLKLAMAMKGHLADQKSVLVFKQEEGGQSVLFSFKAKGELATIHREMLQDGLAFHTLVPAEGGATVYVADLDGSAFDAVEKAAERYDTEVTYQFGRAEFIGTEQQDGTDREQRDSARRAYEQVIAQSPIQGSEEIWSSVRNRWGTKQVDDVARKFDPNQPRDEDGKWTDGGGSTNDSPVGADVGPLDPSVINVGGDSWNKAAAVRLEREYQAAKPKLEALVTSIGDRLGEGGDTDADDEDEDGGPYIPESWSELSSDDQDKTFEQYKENNFAHYHESFVQNWFDNGDALDTAKTILANDPDDWLEEAIQDHIDNSETNYPLDAEQLASVIDLDYADGYSGNGTFSVSFDDDKLRTMIEQELGIEGQQTLPGIEPEDLAKRLTDDMRNDLERDISKAFDKKAEDKAGDLEAPDYLSEHVAETIASDWDHGIEDEQKFKYAQQYGIIEGDESPKPKEQEITGLPGKYDPLGQGEAADYKRTQNVARMMSIERAQQVMKDRGVETDIETIQRLDRQFWSDWKSSSTSAFGQLLQVAIADELGGRLNPTTGHNGAVKLDREELIAMADGKTIGFQIPGGYNGVKAYVRAKWETTQFLLDKAGVKELELYRGISLDPEKLSQAEKEKLLRQLVGSFDKVPNLNIVRNGAASTTTSRDVANDWSYDGSRLVLRILTPRTAAVSVPAYGINVHSEKEVVIAGTAWKTWDAWLRKAPSFDKQPLAA